MNFHFIWPSDMHQFNFLNLWCAAYNKLSVQFLKKANTIRINHLHQAFILAKLLFRHNVISRFNF